MFEQTLPKLLPISFISLEAHCHKITDIKQLKSEKHKLGNTHFFTLEESFTNFYLGFNDEGLYFSAEINVPFQDVFYPDITRGDSLELFIDTKNLKTASFNTPFCHHFFFLPKPYNGVQKGEITSFRGESARPFVDEKDISLQVTFHKNSYILNIFLPRDCLHGYDQEESKKIGFNYRVNRFQAPPEHFSASGDEFAIKERPQTYATLLLTDEDKKPLENIPLRRRALKKL